MEEGNELVPHSELHLLMEHYSNEARRVTAQINGSWLQDYEIRRLVAELTGEPIDPSFRLFPPIYSDFGKNLHFGRNVFVNSCCCFQDQGGIYIGDNCLIGHQTVIATINHNLDPSKRGNCICKPVHLANNVWLGANVKILPGISIGENAVIAAGAVVAKDVPANAIVGGVPAKIMGQVPHN